MCLLLHYLRPGQHLRFLIFPVYDLHLHQLVRYADKYGEEGKLPVAVHILADELANTGAILELNKKISVIRSRNLSISCIFQNLPQMQNRYPYNQMAGNYRQL